MGSSEPVRVLGMRPSPFVARVRIALNLKGVEYEFHEEHLGNKSELLLKSNPVHKKVPVLLHGDRPVCESFVIVEYVDEVWSSSAPSILPSHPYDRAVARFWAAFVDDVVFKSLGGIRKSKGKEELEAAIQQLKQNLFLLEEAFEKTSKGKPFFSGEDHIGFLDIALGSMLGWTGVIERITGTQLFDDKTPKLAQWATRFRCEPAVNAAVPSIDELIEFNKTLPAVDAAATN